MNDLDDDFAHSSTTGGGGLSEHLLSHQDDLGLPGNNNINKQWPRLVERRRGGSRSSVATRRWRSHARRGGHGATRPFPRPMGRPFISRQARFHAVPGPWGGDGRPLRDTTTAEDDDTTRYWWDADTFVLLLLTGLLSLATGGALVYTVMRVAEPLLQVALVGTVAAQGLLALYMAIVQGFWVGAAGCAVLCMLTAGYAAAVWRRIPLAAVTLKIASQALQQNGSVLLVAMSMALTMCLWMMAVWMLALVGVYARTTVQTSDPDDDVAQGSLPGWTVALLLLSLFWTTAVSGNIVHVTVSGTVGTWWFCPDEANRFWSPAVWDSWRRALTYSLGSICLGSLLAALMHLLHLMARTARRQSQQRHHHAAGMLLCVVECLVRCTERLLLYFNKWAFVYVGLYGYDYLTAGQKVITLFQERGWTNIIQDDLIHRCLQLVALGVGCLTGVVAVALAQMHPTWLADTWRYSENGQVTKTAWTVVFAVGFAVGTAVGHMLLGVVASAVNTVLVTWAEAPLELERNYPGLYAAQVAAWRQAYPREFGM